MLAMSIFIPTATGGPANQGGQPRDFSELHSFLARVVPSHGTLCPKSLPAAHPQILQVPAPFFKKGGRHSSMKCFIEHAHTCPHGGGIPALSIYADVSAQEYTQLTRTQELL